MSLINNSIKWLLLSFFALPAIAQQISQDHMQKMMQGAAEMQACFAQIDQQALMDMAQKAQAMEAEVRSLCQAGKRRAAQDTALEFGRTVANDKNMKVARQCSEKMQGMMAQMKGMLPEMDYPASEEDLKGLHICDGY